MRKHAVQLIVMVVALVVAAINWHMAGLVSTHSVTLEDGVNGTQVDLSIWSYVTLLALAVAATMLWRIWKDGNIGRRLDEARDPSLKKCEVVDAINPQGPYYSGN